MKKLLTVLTITGMSVACNDGTESSNNADSTGTTSTPAITTDSNTTINTPVDPDTVTLERGADPTMTPTTTDSAPQ